MLIFPRRPWNSPPRSSPGLLRLWSQIQFRSLRTVFLWTSAKLGHDLSLAVNYSKTIFQAGSVASIGSRPVLHEENSGSSHEADDNGRIQEPGLCLGEKGGRTPGEGSSALTANPQEAFALDVAERTSGMT